METGKTRAVGWCGIRLKSYVPLFSSLQILECLCRIDFNASYNVKNSDTMASQNAIIKLNVGGEVFKTTKSTLKKFDGFLKTLVETSIPVVRDADGCYIIQRNSKHFALILNYLRYGSIRLPGDYHTLKAISEEADYYLLFELRAMCDKKKHVVKKTLNIHKPKIRRSLPLFERQLRASIAALMRTCRMEMRRESERTRWEQSFVLRQAQHRVSN